MSNNTYSDKDKLLNLLLAGYSFSYKRLTLADVSKYVKGKRKYQVHLETGDRISELHYDPEHAVDRFMALKRKEYGEI